MVDVLESFRLLFWVESVFGIQRVYVVAGAVGPPTALARSYSLAVVCGLLYFIYYSVVELLRVFSTHVDSTEDWLGLIVEPLYELMLFVVLIDTVFLNGSRTARVFTIFEEIDKQLNIYKDSEIYNSILKRNRNVLILVANVVAYVLIGLVWFSSGFIRIEQLPIVTLMALFELELLLCSCILANIKSRMCYITKHILKKFSLRSAEMKGDARDIRRRKLFCIYLSYDFDVPTNTFDLNMSTIYKLYEKLLNVFHITNCLFNLQIFIFYAMNLMRLLISIYLFIETTQSQEGVSIGYYFANFMWWQRIGMAVYFSCYHGESVTTAVEQFKAALVELLHDVRYEAQHCAALLRYRDASELQFTVYRLFSMNI